MIEKQLQLIEERAARATPGPWYAHATDDMHASNARYVSVAPGNIFHHDNKRGMLEGASHQAKPEDVVAITLLQSPKLACAAHVMRIRSLSHMHALTFPCLSLRFGGFKARFLI